MSDETYSIVAILSTIAAAVALVLRIRAARIARRLQRLLEEEDATTGKNTKA